MNHEIDTGTEELLCEVTDRVATLTLNKPPKKNALGDILTPALRTLLPRLEDMDDVGCVMITGAGNAFCSGGDVSGMGQGQSAPATKDERIQRLIKGQLELTGRLYQLRKPTVAALPGTAAGAGLSIALACDLRIASEGAFITTAFRNIGLSGDYGASWFLPRLVGLARAKSLFYRAQRISGEECLAMGLFDAVFPEASFRQHAFDYAKEIAQGPTAALGRMKVNLQRGIEQSLPESFELEARHMIESGSSDQAREAIRAFMEKRRPIFHNDKDD